MAKALQESERENARRNRPTVRIYSSLNDTCSQKTNSVLSLDGDHSSDAQ